MIAFRLWLLTSMVGIEADRRLTCRMDTESIIKSIVLDIYILDIYTRHTTPKCWKITVYIC